MNEVKRKILDCVDFPKDIKDFSIQELTTLSKELREELINKISLCGGHFASSLGVVELTVALHYFFNTPEDKLIWDVGHQGYIHKMLTGRKNDISNIRKKGHISGYLKIDESPFDTFGSGHAGNSISAGVGIATAFKNQNNKNYVIPIIGDASISSGMCFEALNHAGELNLDNLIVILNDNEMAISQNVGAIKWVLNRASTSDLPTKIRAKAKSYYNKGIIPSFIYKIFDRIEEAFKGIISTPAMLFESFGFRYIGPVDGHNIEQILLALKHAKNQDRPVLLHVKTIKGKGFKEAEKNPTSWHACIPFNPQNGKARNVVNKKAPTYTEVFSKTVQRLISENKNIVAITAAMLTGTGLNKVKEVFPNKVFDVGICESHGVTFAGGLALQGQTPIVAIYSTFLQRAFDQIVHDVALQKLPVIFALDRAGCVGGDGETHQGAFDISYLRFVPNMILMAPRNESELSNMLFSATKYNAPTVIRYPRGEATGEKINNDFSYIEIGQSEIIQRGKRILLISYGTIFSIVKEASEIFFNETGILPTIIDARFVKPLDEKTLIKEIKSHDIICTIEDGAIQSGFGSAILEMVSNHNLEKSIMRFGIQDKFIPHGTQKEQYEMNKFSSKDILNYLKTTIAFNEIKIAVGK